jgi:hypothetical protein
MPRLFVDEIFLSGIQVALETGTGSELRGLEKFTPSLECDVHYVFRYININISTGLLKTY